MRERAFFGFRERHGRLLAAAREDVSAILGIIADSPTGAVPDEELDRLLDAFAAVRGDGRRVHRLQAGKRAQLAKVEEHDGDRPPLRDGAAWAAWSGYVHQPASALEGPIAELEGQFALVRHDAERGEISVACDPFGMQALFVTGLNGRTYISTSSLALARALGCPPSRLGLQSFVTAGYQFGAVTLWEGVRRLDPASLLLFGRSGRLESTYWRPEVDRGVARLPFRRSVDHCVEVLADTFTALLGERGPAWMDLTGGYDSRLLACVFARIGLDVRCNTRQTPSGDDEPLAQRLASALGLPWTLIAYPSDWPRRLPSELEGSLAAGDGNLEVLQLARVMWAHRQLAPLPHRLLSGGGGERFQ